MPPVDGQGYSWSTGLDELRRFAQWQSSQQGGGQPWNSVPFPYKRTPPRTAIPDDAVGIYMIVHAISLPAIKSDGNDRLRTVVYVGQGKVLNRYRAHVTGDTNRRLKLVLDALATMRDTQFAFYWKRYECDQERSGVETLVYDALGPVGNDIRPPRVRLKEPIPAG